MALPRRCDYVNVAIAAPADLIENCYFFSSFRSPFHSASPHDRPELCGSEPANYRINCWTRRPGFRPKVKLILFSAFEQGKKFRFHLALCMQNQLLGMLFFSTLHNFFSVAALVKTKSHKKAFNLYFSLLCATFFRVHFRFGIVHNHEREK